MIVIGCDHSFTTIAAQVSIRLLMINAVRYAGVALLLSLYEILMATIGAGLLLSSLTNI